MLLKRCGCSCKESARRVNRGISAIEKRDPKGDSLHPFKGIPFAEETKAVKRDRLFFLSGW